MSLIRESFSTIGPENRTYVQLGQVPLAWYWNLPPFLGGLAVAAGSRYRDFREARNGQKST